MDKALALLRTCKSFCIGEHFEMYPWTSLYQLALALCNLQPSEGMLFLVLGFTILYCIGDIFPQNLGCNFKWVTLPQIYHFCFTHCFGVTCHNFQSKLTRLRIMIAREIWPRLISCQTWQVCVCVCDLKGYEFQDAWALNCKLFHGICSEQGEDSNMC